MRKRAKKIRKWILACKTTLEMRENREIWFYSLVKQTLGSYIEEDKNKPAKKQTPNILYKGNMSLMIVL